MLGADFEVFVVDKVNNLVHCDKLLPNAKKAAPIKYKGCHITHDRKSLECSIPAFEYNGKPLQFYEEVVKGLTILKEFILSKNKDYKLILKDTWKLESPSTYTKFVEKNVYKGELQQVAVDPYLVTNGLHIHFSGIHKDDKVDLIKSLDKTVGKYYKEIAPNSRRKDYGALGSYKDKNYGNLVQGFEYRTLGGRMLKIIHLKKISRMLNKVVEEYSL